MRTNRIAGRIVLIVASFALLPISAPIALGLATIEVISRNLRKPGRGAVALQRPTRALLVGVAVFTFTALVTQVAAEYRLSEIVPGVIGSYAPASPGYTSPNLVSNRDLSWLVGYSRDGGYGPYATSVGDGFWRIDAVDAVSGKRYTEVVTAKEVQVKADTSYVLSAEVRHDGDFSATLMFRTRSDLWRADTTIVKLNEETVRLSAVLPPSESAERLRVLHLADLRGDYNFIEVGRVQLVPGTKVGPFEPHARPMSRGWGVAWWAGTGALLALVAFWASTPCTRWWKQASVVGLLVGVAAQACIGVVQIASGAPRGTGTLGDPNIFAHVGVVTALVAIALAGGSLWVAAVATVCAAVVVVTSGSLGGSLGFGIGAVGLLVLLPLGRYRVAAMVALITVSLGLLLAVTNGPPPWTDPNVLARVQAWQTAWQLLWKHPLTGVGHGNFSFFHEYFAPFGAGPQLRATHAHSLLNIGAENGFPLLAIFMIGYLLLLVRTLGRQPLTALVLLVVLALNFTDLTIFSAALLVPSWFAAVRASYGQRGPDTSTEPLEAGP